LLTRVLLGRNFGTRNDMEMTGDGIRRNQLIVMLIQWANRHIVMRNTGTSFLEMVVHEHGADDEHVAGAGHRGDDGNDQQFHDAVPRYVHAVVHPFDGVGLRQIIGDGLVHFLPWKEHTTLVAMMIITRWIIIGLRRINRWIKSEWGTEAATVFVVVRCHWCESVN